jgi:hypothetical protein
MEAGLRCYRTGQGLDMRKPIIVDVWGGRGSQDHIARSILPMKDALQFAEQELLAGYLVNLRWDATFGPQHNFDLRQEKPS